MSKSEKKKVSSFLKYFVPSERLELSHLSALVSKTSVSAFHHEGIYRGPNWNQTNLTGFADQHLNLSVIGP